jgi:hypothetical protein
MRWRILVSLLSLAIICFGVGYAVGRERLRAPDHLHALYQETNKEFFNGQLPDVELIRVSFDRRRSRQPRS